MQAERKDSWEPSLFLQQLEALDEPDDYFVPITPLATTEVNPAASWDRFCWRMPDEE